LLLTWVPTPCINRFNAYLSIWLRVQCRLESAMRQISNEKLIRKNIGVGSSPVLSIR
jgi:hypothetical protein